jgi:regulator of protease activity HflC (stomatin/prohibitin superfamily)
MNKKISVAAIIGAVVLLLVIALGALGIRTIKPSTVGVVVRFGKIVSVKENGVTWQMPFVTRITKMDVSQQAVEGVYETSTRDMQTTTEYVTTHFTVDTSKVTGLYTSFLGNHVDSLIKPVLATVVQNGVSTVTIGELVANRVQLANDMTDQARAMLAPYGISVVSMQITNHDFSDAFEAAIEAKIVAEQRVLTAKQEQETAKIQAETNRIMSLSYDENVKFKMFLEKWDGRLPLYTAGENSTLDMLLPTITP